MIWVSSDKNGTKLKHSIILSLPPYRNWNTLKGGHFWRISCDIVRYQHFLFFERYSQLNLSPKKTEKRHFFSRLVWLLSVGQAGLEAAILVDQEAFSRNGTKKSRAKPGPPNLLGYSGWFRFRPKFLTLGLRGWNYDETLRDFIFNQKLSDLGMSLIIFPSARAIPI